LPYGISWDGLDAVILNGYEFNQEVRLSKSDIPHDKAEKPSSVLENHEIAHVTTLLYFQPASSDLAKPS
jgi:hypothetical protein